MKKNVIKIVSVIIVVVVVIFGIINIISKDKRVKLVEGSSVDVIIFMGQSNMSGTGNAKEAPDVISGAGYEFRAISDPNRLYSIVEPFGINENKEGGIYEEEIKCGSMVSSFINAYYEETHTPVVAISASAGGSSLHSWEPGGVLLTDAMDRVKTASEWLSENGYKINHRYMVWLQGESDSNKGTSIEDYKAGLKAIVDDMQNTGIEKCFVIRIGKNTDDFQLHDKIIEAQTQLCSTDEDFVLISTKAIELYDLGLMRDFVHYNQEGLNMVGEDAGSNAGRFVKTGEEPSMYDAYFKDMYTASK